MKDRLFLALLLFSSSLALVGCAVDGQGSFFTDERDGERYEIVTVGDQQWMAENLRFEAPGSYFNGDDNPRAEYGQLYDWETVMNGEPASAASPSGVQGICPAGWHLPSDEEWSALEISLGLDPDLAEGYDWRGTDQGTQMKSTSGWNDDGNGSNSSGFNALPAGRHWTAFGDVGDYGFFWTSTENSSNTVEAWLRFLHKDETGVNRSEWSKTAYAISCRCVRDPEPSE